MELSNYFFEKILLLVNQLLIKRIVNILLLLSHFFTKIFIIMKEKTKSRCSK